MSDAMSEFDMAVVSVLVRRDQIGGVTGPDDAFYTTTIFSRERLTQRGGLDDVMQTHAYSFERRARSTSETI